MGWEEKDQCRTVAIIPLASTAVRLRLFAKDNEIRGQFRIPGATEWRDVGQCSTPVPANGKPKISLQFYQGAQNIEHWARLTEFRILKHQ
jgi:hypothetical protein